VMDPGGDVEYETAGSVTLLEGQNRIRVVARDLEPNEPVPADTLTVLPIPIAGIATVSNPAPTALAAQDETDAELRVRAKHFLHGSERATLGALRQAIARQQITADVEEVEDRPGYIEVRPHVEAMSPELEQRLLTAIRDARPAGVVVTLLGATPPRRIDLELRLTTASGLPEQELRAAQRAVRERVKEYFARLPVREAGSINRLVGLVLSVPAVEDVRLLRAVANGSGNLLNPASGEIEIAGFPTVLGELHVADPNLPTLLNGVIGYPAAADPPDLPKVRSALDQALSYLNTSNAVDPPAPEAVRTLSFGKLLHVIPLPGKPAASLEAFDQAAPGSVTLPTAASVAPYRPQFALTLESGLTRVLQRDADTYTLTPFERVSLGGVELGAEPG
jgi:hypothetical protein